MNKICLITGATSGIGKAVAKELAKLRFDLILTGRNEQKGKKLSDSLNTKYKEFKRSLVYSRLKLANALFTFEFLRKNIFSNIKANALNPGGIATNFAKNEGFIKWFKHLSYYLVKRKLLTPKQGAETVIYFASSDCVKNVTGKYFFEKKETKSSEESYDLYSAKKLWELSEQLCAIKYYIVKDIAFTLIKKRLPQKP